MASLPEINSFISKFVNLWKSGCKASLHLEASAGEAQINLQVGLGQFPPLPHIPVHRVPGPARQRRHQRRAEARKAADEAEAAAKNNAAQAQKEAEADRNDTEQVDYHEVTEDVIEDNQKVEAAKTTALVITEISDSSGDGSKDVTGEFCSDESFKQDQNMKFG